MNKLVTDNPKNNFETMMNMVYGKDGWQYIRHGEKEIHTADFCLKMCRQYGCDEIPEEVFRSNEAKDQLLCDCLFDDCPVAIVYAALCGFGHLRGRLKLYEDAGMIPPEKESACPRYYFAIKDGSYDPETGESDEAGLSVKG